MSGLPKVGRGLGGKEEEQRSDSSTYLQEAGKKVRGSMNLKLMSWKSGTMSGTVTVCELLCT